MSLPTLPLDPFHRASVLPEVSEGLDQLPEGRGEGGSGAVVAREPDPIRVGMLIGNAIAAAVYGPRGEFRKRQGELSETR